MVGEKRTYYYVYYSHISDSSSVHISHICETIGETRTFRNTLCSSILEYRAYTLCIRLDSHIFNCISQWFKGYADISLSDLRGNLNLTYSHKIKSYQRHKDKSIRANPSYASYYADVEGEYICPTCGSLREGNISSRCLCVRYSSMS